MSARECQEPRARRAASWRDTHTHTRTTTLHAGGNIDNAKLQNCFGFPRAVMDEKEVDLRVNRSLFLVNQGRC